MVVSNIFYFHAYLGKIPILTSIFQMGWFNHQLGFSFLFQSGNMCWASDNIINAVFFQGSLPTVAMNQISVGDTRIHSGKQT